MNCIKISANFLIFLSCSLASCSTSYQAAGWGGGYSEIITAPDFYHVTFRGNASTSEETVMKYALLRASELALENGYSYFTVVSSTDQTKTTHYTNKEENTSKKGNASSRSTSRSTDLKESISTSIYSGVIRKPGLTLQIKCFRERPDSIDVIDAGYYVAKNKEK